MFTGPSKFFICLFLVGLSSVCAAKPLVNKLNKTERLDLKWKVRVGKSSYRTTLQTINGLVFAPSHGKKHDAHEDSMDGVHVIDGKTGDVTAQLVLGDYGDRDVNGVAISASKIVFGTDDHVIGAFDWSHNLLWIYTAKGAFKGAPALTFVNTDSVLDVVAATETGTVLALDGSNGTLLWRFKAKPAATGFDASSARFLASPSIKDVNKDGVPDVLIGCQNGDFYALNGKDGTVLWQFEPSHPAGFISPPFVDKRSIYLSETYGYLHQLSFRGRPDQHLSLLPNDSAQIVAMPQVNAKKTIVLGTTFNQPQQGFWHLAPFSKDLFQPFGKISSSALLANVDTDASAEFVFISEDGWLVVLDESGQAKGRYKLLKGGTATPLIADVDQDSELELLLLLDDQHLYCYELPSKGPVLWGQYRANLYNTGVNQDVLIEDSPVSGLEHRTLSLTKNASLWGFSYTNWFSMSVSAFLISKAGIGHAQLGMTLSQFKQKIGHSVQLTDLKLDNGLKATSVYFDDAVQYYLVFSQQSPVTDASKITMVITNNPDYKLASGQGSGSRVSSLESRLGSVSFSYNRQFPLEERLRFSTQPRWLVFSSYSKTKAGIYGYGKTPVKVTNNYESGALIQFITVR